MKNVTHDQTVGRRRVTSISDLREMIGTPSERAVRKQLGGLDRHCRAFIERSPFMLLGTSGTDGRCDVSPKGDRPGFVLVEDDNTVVIPDRPGNKRCDSLQNILQNPHVGLLFLIPGMDETLRINGSAELVQDENLLQRLAVDGKAPVLAIVVRVEESLFALRTFVTAGPGLGSISLHGSPGYAQPFANDRRSDATRRARPG